MGPYNNRTNQKKDHNDIYDVPTFMKLRNGTAVQPSHPTWVFSCF